MRRKFTRTCILLLLFAGSFPTLANAFTNNDSLKAQLIKDWERAKAYTKEYIDAMPEDGINYKPSPEVRSFAEQMLHLSQGNVGLSSNGTGRERIYPGKNLEKMEEFKSKGALTKVVMECYDFVIDGIRSFDAGKFEEKVKRGNFDESRLAWLNKAFEHQTHHRGQTTVYLRMKGIAPPAEKLF
ncbi:MAG TPA: DinB family protein [Chitinophagaceae bacterium]